MLQWGTHGPFSLSGGKFENNADDVFTPLQPPIYNIAYPTLSLPSCVPPALHRTEQSLEANAYLRKGLLGGRGKLIIFMVTYSSNHMHSKCISMPLKLLWDTIYTYQIDPYLEVGQYIILERLWGNWQDWCVYKMDRCHWKGILQ